MSLRLLVYLCIAASLCGCGVPTALSTQSPTSTSAPPTPTLTPSLTSTPTVTHTATSLPTLTSTPTLVLPTLIPTPTAVQLKALDKHDVRAVMEWFMYMMKFEDPAMVADLMGNHGVEFAPYGVGVLLPGYNNYDEIIEVLRKALDISDPICFGYFLYGDANKAYLFYRDVRIDWLEYNLTNDSGITQFAFFEFEDGWEFVVISPIREWLGFDTDSLEPCLEK